VISYREIFNPASTLQGNKVETRPRLKALIIDDETDICYLLKGILRSRDIEANYASTLAEGEALLRQNDPDIIFLDNHLPDGFGVDRIHQIKELNPFCKVVMITAHDTSSDRDKAYKEGVDFFIGKPFTREMIIKTVEKIL
jgi:DNA-binding NtrC family response regulator